jgi:hypothetical protein
MFSVFSKHYLSLLSSLLAQGRHPAGLTAEIALNGIKCEFSALGVVS